MTRARRARLAGIAALLLWPLSYAWIPLAERSPAWVLALVPLAEISAVVLGITAVMTSGLWTGMDSVAPTLTLAGLVAFSIGWVALGWTAIRLDQPAVATA